MPQATNGVAAILLAAGQGKRFGSDKLISSFRTRPLWEWSASAAEEAGFDALFVVVSPQSNIAARTGWVRVENPKAADGMGTSIAAGVRAASNYKRVVILLADMPFVPASHLTELIQGDGVIFTQHDNGRAGCPAAFPRKVFASLGSLKGEEGAKTVSFTDAAVLDLAQPTLLSDIDTRADLERLES